MRIFCLQRGRHNSIPKVSAAHGDFPPESTVLKGLEEENEFPAEKPDKPSSARRSILTATVVNHIDNM